MKGSLHPGLLLTIWLMGLLSLIPMTLVLQSVFPRFLHRASDAMERGRVQTFITGFLGLLILAITCLRLTSAKLLGGVLMVLLGTLLVFGLAAVFRSIGGRMYFSMNSPRSDLAWPSTLLGGIVLWMSALLPILGQLVLLVSCMFGLGGVLIALFTRSPKPQQAIPPVLPKV